MKPKLSENQIVTQFLALGHIDQAIQEAKHSGLNTLASNIEKSVSGLKDPGDYYQFYKQDWEGVEKRIPGMQVIEGWGLDERQRGAAQMIQELNARSILDVGCSDGSFIFGLLNEKIVDRGHGVDPWINGIKWAMNHSAARHQGRATFTQGVFEDAIVPGTFDVAHFGEILEHVIDPVPLLKKAKEHLNPNGGIVITVPVERPPLSDEEYQKLTSGELNQHVRYVNEQALEGFASRAGLSLKKSVRLGTSWVNLIALLS